MTRDATIQRVCFLLRVRPELLDEYRRAHEAVWPAMLREIEASGRRDYSLFLAEDGLLVGYFEAESPEESARYLAASPVAAEWEAAMSRFFVSMDGRADQAAPHLAEVFNLAQQLRSVDDPPLANPPLADGHSPTRHSPLTDQPLADPGAPAPAAPTATG